MSVLILTLPGDYHAHAVSWAIRKLGGEVIILYPLDICSRSQWSFDPDANVIKINANGATQTIHRDDYDTVWMRRPVGIYPKHNITDTAQRAVAEEELRLFVTGILGGLEKGKFTVNNIQSSSFASNKSYQMAVAAGIGLNGPKTLISNATSEIISFFEICGNEFVYKPLTTAVWTLSNGNKSAVPTTLITEKSVLLEADLYSAPGIYQEKITKQAEVRATFMGKSIFAWEKRFDRRPHDELHIDWRAMNTMADHKLHELPENIKAKCFELMSALNLHYGAFDFAIDQNGDYQFLEVNPQGQFLWGDQLGLGLNQLEAFAEFLLSGDPSFQYSYSNRLDLSEYHNTGIYDKAAIEERELHDGDLMQYNYKQVSVAF